MLQALLLAIWAGLCTWDQFGPHLGFRKPLLASVGVGIILGDMTTAIMIGATMELMWLGVNNIGAYVPPDVISGTIVGAALGIMGSTDTASAIALAVAIGIPTATLVQQLNILVMTTNVSLVHGADKAIGQEMLNWLRGPRPLNGQDISFMKDRFRGDRSYIIFSYFGGATPENNYTPSQPYTVTVTSDPHSYDEDNYARLYVACGGADSPRPIKLRMKGDGKWLLWEQYLLTGIRTPKSDDPWA